MKLSSKLTPQQKETVARELSRLDDAQLVQFAQRNPRFFEPESPSIAERVVPNDVLADQRASPPGGTGTFQERQARLREQIQQAQFGTPFSSGPSFPPMEASPTREGLAGALPVIAGTAAGLVPLPPAIKAPFQRAPGAIESLGRILAKPATLAVQGGSGAAIAGGAGAAGGAIESILQGDTLEQAAQNIVQRGKEQAIADPISRSLGKLGSLLARPTAKSISTLGRKVLEFAREEGLFIDPSVFLVATKENPIGGAFGRAFVDFAKRFIGSGQVTRGRLQEIAEVMSADPSVPSRMLKPFLSPKKDIAKAEPIRRLIEEASESAGELEFKVINGEIFEQLLKRDKASLKRIYGKKVIERLENFAAFAKVHKNVPLQLTSESEILTMKTIAANTLAAGAAAPVIFDPIGLGGLSAFGVVVTGILARGIANPNHPISKWLTTGLIPDASSHIAKRIGGKAIGLGGSATIRSVPQLLGN